MLRFASSLGGCASFRSACGLFRPRRGADGCARGTRARKRRSNPARTAAEILVADLNRPAHGTAVGMRLDFDGMAQDVLTLLVGARLKEGAARNFVDNDIDPISCARRRG